MTSAKPRHRPSRPRAGVSIYLDRPIVAAIHRIAEDYGVSRGDVVAEAVTFWEAAQRALQESAKSQ